MKIVTVNLNPCIDWLCEVPRFTHGGLNRVRRVRSDVAGKGLNVAIALKNLGVEPLCVGVNFSENGRVLTEKLDALGVRHDFIEAPGAIRVNMKLRETSSGVMTEINQPGAYVPAEIQARLVEKIARHKADILVLSGSRPEGMPADFYAKICEGCDGKIFLDTEGEALRLALETGKIFAVKPNLFELESTFSPSPPKGGGSPLGEASTFGVNFPGLLQNCENQPAVIAGLTRNPLCSAEPRGFRVKPGMTKKEAAPAEVANFCREKLPGVQIVCCSMGAEGAVLVTPGGGYFCPALPVDARGLAGAGDAMVAGMVYAVVKNMPVGEFLPVAMAAAAASVVLEGTQMCTAAGFDEMLRKIPEIRAV